MSWSPEGPSGLRWEETEIQGCPGTLHLQSWAAPLLPTSFLAFPRHCLPASQFCPSVHPSVHHVLTLWQGTWCEGPIHSPRGARVRQPLPVPSWNSVEQKTDSGSSDTKPDGAADASSTALARTRQLGPPHCRNHEGSGPVSEPPVAQQCSSQRNTLQLPACYGPGNPGSPA